MKTLQKPLTPEEEKYYLQQYKQGSLEAKNILIERNLRLVAHIVKKYQGAVEELDDLISIGTIGLIKAIHTFDAGKASRLSTYAARCIDNAILSPIHLWLQTPYHRISKGQNGSFDAGIQEYIHILLHSGHLLLSCFYDNSQSIKFKDLMPS